MPTASKPLVASRKVARRRTASGDLEGAPRSSPQHVSGNATDPRGDMMIAGESGIFTKPAVGLSENLGILPGGYFARRLAKHQRG